MAVSFCLVLTLPSLAFAETALKPEDSAYLDQLEKAAFHGFGKLLDPITRFPVDGAPVSQGNVVRLNRSVRFNKTSPAHLAFAFFYYVLAGERGWIPKEEAYANLSELLDNLDSLESFEGFLYQWYSISGRPEEWPRVTVNRFVPVYENALLDAALMCSAGAYPGTSLARGAERILAKKDYRFFYDRNSARENTQLLNQGYDAAKGIYADRDYGIFNAPSRLAVLLGILKDGVPEKAWKNQERLVRDYETLEGKRLSVLASWSGGLAETLLTDEILAGDRLAPAAFGKNARLMIEIQRDKGRRLSGSGIWGFSSGEAPDQGRYEPMGVSEVAYQRSGQEFVTPYSAALALRYQPVETLANFRAIQKKNPGVFGSRYGFADSIDPVTGEVNRNILSLDKGLEFMAFANYQSVRSGGKDTASFLWAYFKVRGWEKKALHLLKSEEAMPQYAVLDGARAQAGADVKPPVQMDLIKQSRDIGTFYDPDRSKAAYRMIEKEGRAPSIGLRYDVSRPAAFSGLYVKLRPSDFSRYRTFHFRIKGSPDRGYPQKMKVELKNRGQSVQFAQISPGQDWQDVQVPLPRFLSEVDEVAFVFDNAQSGKNRRGEVLLEALYFN